jgi:hypothetical protein
MKEGAAQRESICLCPAAPAPPLDGDSHLSQRQHPEVMKARAAGDTSNLNSGFFEMIGLGVTVRLKANIFVGPATRFKGPL